MTAIARNTLKGYFNTGAKPTQLQFATLIDSFLSLTDDQITIDMVAGLQNALNGKAIFSQVTALIGDITALTTIPNASRDNIVHALQYMIANPSGSALSSPLRINIPGNPFGKNGVTYTGGLEAMLRALFSQATPPIVSAGTTQNLNLSQSLTLTLTGAATAGTSGITSTTWVQVSGPVQLTIATPNALTTSVTGFTTASAGSYQFELKCFTADGAEVDAFVTDVIAYIPPQIQVSNQNIQLPTNSGQLSAVVTAGSYAASTTVWTFTGSQQGVTCNASGAYTLPNVADTYQFTVTVTDVNGHTSTANESVIVAPAAFNAVVDYVFLDHDGYAGLQTADTLTYSHYAISSNNADWLMPWSNAPANCFPVMRVLSSANQTLKNRFTDQGNPTFGTDTFDANSSSARKFTIRGYDYYTWYSPANFVTTAGNTVNITIN